MFPLRVRSYYSLLQGTSSPATLCRLARELGFTGLAITDRDNLYGLWGFLKACSHEGIRPIIGAEISDPGSGEVITCLVQNETGYANLCTMLTKRHMEKSFTLAGNRTSSLTLVNSNVRRSFSRAISFAVPSSLAS